MIIKRLVISLYLIIIILLASATLIEHRFGTGFVGENIYDTWWFALLWALLAAIGCIYIIRSHIRRWNILLLHVSLAVILMGALLTHLFAFRGVIHLRVGQTSNQYRIMKSMETSEKRQLPFSIRLDRFDINYYRGTQAVKDYISHLSIIDGNQQHEARISMNNIFEYRSVRLCQNSYDTDKQGSYISLNSDPYGIIVTYAGYAMLFFSLLWLLIDPQGTFRQLLRSETLRRGLLLLTLLFGFQFAKDGVAAVTVPRTSAELFGELYINYNDRVCPVQTYARDFLQKLYGQHSYHGLTAEQVLMDCIFFSEEWSTEPLVYIKNSEVRKRLDLPIYAAINSFFKGGDYILGQYLREYGQGQEDNFHKACADIDSRLQLFMMLQDGSPLTLFPHTDVAGQTIWYSPADQFPATMSKMNILFIKNVFPLLYGQIVQGDYGGVNHILHKVREYQRKKAATTLPTDTQIACERLYNRIPFTTILFIVNLTMGLITLFFTIRSMSGRKPNRGANLFSLIVLGLSFAALTAVLMLRWIISENIPMSNGYETMLTVAWFAMLISFIAYHKAHIVLVFGFLLSGFFLLVSHIGQMDPAIGQIMPVLNSPLLSIHVSITMMSYALLALTFICAITALSANLLSVNNRKPLMESLQTLSLLFLYPALVALGFGIFIGAIWANISWGQYWSWDPKETWALITFLIYAAAIHTRTLPMLRRPLIYHLYMLIAFLSILMTYFGVNYVLGGMHAYA